MTRARIVTPGQARAMIPTIMARTPRRIRDVDIDLNMTDIPFVLSSGLKIINGGGYGLVRLTSRAVCRRCEVSPVADRGRADPAGAGAACGGRPRSLALSPRGRARTGRPGVHRRGPGVCGVGR